MKYLLYILDGAADKQYNGKTPLETANTPTFDQLCSQGELKRWSSIPSNMSSGTDTAMATLFGIKNSQHIGRAAIEAIADGIDIKDAVVYRTNFLHVSDYTIQKYFPSKQTDNELNRLATDLVHETTWKHWMKEQTLNWAIGKSGNVYLLAHNQAPISNTPMNLIGKPYYDFWPDGWAKWGTQMALFLADHPWNEERRYQNLPTYDLLWPWGEGKTIDVASFYQQYQKKGACISATPIVKGVAQLAGLYVPDIAGVTGDIDTDIDAKADAVNRLWDEYDFVLLHLDAPDVCSHQQDIQKKIQAIELGDRLLNKVLTDCRENMRIGIACDHYTFCETGQHGEQAVPCMFTELTSQTIINQRFCERDADRMASIDGQDILSYLFK